MDYSEILKEGARQFNIDLSSEQIDKFMVYKKLLLEWNEKINLTAIEDEGEVIIKHFLDSISCLLTDKFTNHCTVIDVGTGAGFPGLPIKIVRQDISITLLDSLNKRINFLNEVINKLYLPAVETLHGRAEDIGNNKYREKFDISISRAVANLSVLAEYCLPLVKIGGYFISMKGPDVKEELEQANKAIDILGGELSDVKLVRLPFTEINHSLVIVKKIRQCPTKYPRKAGKPAKEPIR
ncbi:MAG: rRNA (guanine527-N7)-methyltransferase [Petroclostridium sp.]|jgi:16S rRNA (guanine527-N7)-methyltransferase|nr:rRNA methyltransferase [Clostridia bacterium]MDK2810445.1 rRNA (guanine527-N7)-methyltransferase [Petroclostridium sp.]